MPDKSTRQIGTLARGLAILDCIRTTDRPMGLADIADACDLDASTAHRLLQLLITSGYVLRDEKTKKHIGSPKLLFPLSLYSPLSEFRRDASNAANRIKEETNETIGFVLFCINERIIVEVSHGKSSLTLAYDTWLQSPIHASVSGKINILSKGSGMPEFIRSLELKRHTELTICDPVSLENQLLGSYKQGFVTARDEYLKGLTAIGAPIWNHAGACIGCIFLNARSADCSEQRIQELGEFLCNESHLFSHSTPSVEPVSHMLSVHQPTSFNRDSYLP